MPLTRQEIQALQYSKATPRYSDAWRNALLASHEIALRVEISYNNAYVGTLDIVDGSVSCDRASSVRRTATLTIDPSNLDDPVLAPRLNPYGTHVKIWRGIRYPSGAVEEGQLFHGRLDSVEESFAGINLRCSDFGSYMVDGRFYEAWRPIRPLRVVALEAKAMILDGLPATMTPPTVFLDGIAATDATLVAPDFNIDQERVDGLDQLCTTIGCEWFADEVGDFHIRPLPAVITPSTLPVWIIDSGDEGVLIERVTTVDRQNVFNGAKVDGVAVGGDTGATNHYEAKQSESPDLYWGGPFGKIPQFYSGQSLRTTKSAYDLAQQLVAQSLSQVSALSVTCVPNAKLRLADVVRVFDRRAAINNLYYIQSMEIPLGPGEPMTMTLNRALSVTPSGELRDALPTMPEGTRWTPWRSNEST